MADPELERKLNILMALAAHDREGLPPRLRHTWTLVRSGPSIFERSGPDPACGPRCCASS